MKIVKAFASLKLTLVGFVLLGLGAALSYDNQPGAVVWVIVLPLLLLAINLLAAIFTNSRINSQPGLLLFHLALLGLVSVIAIGRLTYLDAHIEIVESQPFDPSELTEEFKGPFFSGPLNKVHFIQGPYTVDYEAKMLRGLTYSQVFLPDEQGNMVKRVVGDDRPLLIEGFRFYTTFNKGFSVLITWIPEEGPPVSGTVNMPSYPLFDYKQGNTWSTPNNQEIKFWLQLETGLKVDEAWRLDGRNASGVLIVSQDKARIEMQPGDTIAVQGGRLRYEKLLTWMGYKVFYNPTIKWLFYISLICVFGLSWHFWTKLASKPWPAGVKTTDNDNNINNNINSKTESSHVQGSSKTQMQGEVI